MAINITDGFNLNFAAPIDYRMVSANSTTRAAIVYKYDGMKVLQQDNRLTYIWNSSSSTWSLDNPINVVTGTGSLNYVPKVSSVSGYVYYSNSSIFDNGKVGIGTNNPLDFLQIGLNAGFFGATSSPITINGNTTSDRFLSYNYCSSTGLPFNSIRGSSQIGFGKTDGSIYFNNMAAFDSLDTTLILKPTGQALFLNGSDSQPSISFINKTDTGMYLSGLYNELLSFSIGGSRRFVLKAGGASEVVILSPNESRQVSWIVYDSGFTQHRINAGGGVYEFSGFDDNKFYGTFSIIGNQWSTTGHKSSLLLGDGNHFIQAIWGGPFKIKSADSISIGRTSGDTHNIFINNSTGNIGLGTNNPLSNLDIRRGDTFASGTQEIRFGNSGGGGTNNALIKAVDESTVVFPVTRYKSSLQFHTQKNSSFISLTESMRIDINGRLLVGRTNNPLNSMISAQGMIQSYSGGSPKMIGAASLVVGSSVWNGNVHLLSGQWGIYNQSFIQSASTDSLVDGTTGGYGTAALNPYHLVLNPGGGNIGIGVAPSYKLDVLGDINSSTTVRSAIVRADNDFTTGTDTPGWIPYFFGGNEVRQNYSGNWNNPANPAINQTGSDFNKAHMHYKIIGKTVFINIRFIQTASGAGSNSYGLHVLIPQLNFRDYNANINTTMTGSADGIGWNSSGSSMMMRVSLRKYGTSGQTAAIFLNKWILVWDRGDGGAGMDFNGATFNAQLVLELV